MKVSQNWFKKYVREESTSSAFFSTSQKSINIKDNKEIKRAVYSVKRKHDYKNCGYEGIFIAERDIYNLKKK